MATQNSANQDYSNESDGFKFGGGLVKRFLKLTGGNVTISGSGSNAQYTFPAEGGTLINRDSTDTLTNKTIDGGSNTIKNVDAASVDLEYQDNTTDISKTGVKVQVGWGFLTGDGSNDYAYEAVTFPKEFSKVYCVTCTCNSSNESSNPTDIYDTNQDRSRFLAGAQSVTTSGFNASICSGNGAAMGTSSRFVYSWMAFGEY